jgi:hypothetical protein
MEPIEAAIRLLNEPLAKVNRLLNLPAKGRDMAFKSQYLSLEGTSQLSPDTSEAAEAATLDDQREEGAAATWQNLEEPQRSALLAMLKNRGANPNDLTETLNLRL